MATPTNISAKNHDMARRINDEARNDAHSPYVGKFVGIANGQVVAVADELDTLVARLRQIEPNQANTLCFEAGLDYETVQDILGYR